MGPAMSETKDSKGKAKPATWTGWMPMETRGNKTLWVNWPSNTKKKLVASLNDGVTGWRDYLTICRVQVTAEPRNHKRPKGPEGAKRK